MSELLIIVGLVLYFVFLALCWRVGTKLGEKSAERWWKNRETTPTQSTKKEEEDE